MHDVVVIGAGPAGAAAAHFLAAAGADVRVLDRSRFPRDKTCGDALTPRALAVLRDMDVLDEVRALGGPVMGVRVVAPGGHQSAAAIPRVPGIPAAALVVPRRDLDAAILGRAVRTGARFDGGARVDRVEREADGVTIHAIRDGAPLRVRARAAVIATGAAFALHLRMGVLRRPPPVMRAARAYFEGVADLDGALQCRFDGVPLPGYGWVFPISATSANVGAGVFAQGWRAWRRPLSVRETFDEFVGAPALRALLRNARRTSAVAGYPLRADFARATVHGERFVLAGEAAGLVNPLTGEGIDYALESGRLAAAHLARALRAGSLDRAALSPYERELRARFQSLFVFCARMRDLYVNRFFMDRLVATAARRPELNRLLVDVVLGNRSAAEALAWRNVLRVALVR